MTSHLGLYNPTAAWSILSWPKPGSLMYYTEQHLLGATCSGNEHQIDYMDCCGNTTEYKRIPYTISFVSAAI